MLTNFWDTTLACEVLCDQAVDKWGESLACARQNEGCGRGVPVKFEAGGERGDPDLAYGRIGRDDELARRLFEEDIEHAILLLDFEAGIVLFFALDEVLQEGLMSDIDQTAEL